MEARGARAQLGLELPGDAVLRRVHRDTHVAGVRPAGGWTFVDFRNKRDTEPGFDFLTVEWSTDGTNWRAAKWIWDTATGAWSDQLSFGAQNAGYPAFVLEKVAFKAPAGSLQVRFRFSADQLISTPLYTGVHVDDVSIGR